MKIELAKSIAILLNHGARWHFVYYIFYILCLDFELSIILDRELLFYDVKSYQRASTKYLSGTILDYNGKLLTLVGSSNLQLYLSSSNIALIYVLAVVLLVISVITVLQLFLHWPFPGMLRNGAALGFWSTILYHYEYLFIFTSSLFFKTALCVKNTKQASLADFQGSYLDIKATSRISSEVYELDYYTSSISRKMTCQSIDHIFVCILTSVVLLCSFLLLAISNKIMGFRPDPKIASKLNSWDLIHPMTIVVIFLFKIGLLNIGDSVSPAKTFYFFTAFLLLCDLVVHVSTRSFYDPKVNTLRTIEISVLLVFTLLAIEHTSIGLIPAKLGIEIQVMIWLALLLTIALKVYFSAFENKQIDTKKRSDKGPTTAKAFFQAVYYFQQFLLRADEGKCSEEEKNRLVSLAMEFYYWLHARQTGTHDQAAELILKISREHVEGQGLQHKLAMNVGTDIVDKKVSVGLFGVGQLVRDLVTLLETLFEVEVKKYNHQQMQIPSHLMNAHIYFLFNFKGQASLACSLMRKMFAWHKQERSFLKTLDANILRESVSLKLEAQIEPSELRLMSTEKDDDQIQIQLNHLKAITFFNHMKRIKANIRDLLELRGEVLSSLSENSLTSKRLYENAEKNISLRVNTDKLLTEAYSIGGTSCSPLVIIHCFYIKFVEFNFPKSSAKLKAILSKPYALSTPERSQQDLALNHIRRNYLEASLVVGISMEKENFHKISLVSSNVAEYLEYSVTELLHEDLGLLVPNPVREVHHRIAQPSSSEGSLIRNAKELTAFIVTKSGEIREMVLTLRVNSCFDNGMQVVSLVRFVKADTELKDMFLILCLKTKQVLEVSKSCSKYFTRNSAICSQTNPFWEKLEAFWKVTVFHKENPTFDINEVLESGLSMEDVRAYIELSDGVVLDIDEEDSMGSTQLVSYFTPLQMRGSADNHVVVRFLHADSTHEEAEKSKNRWTAENLRTQKTLHNLGISALIGINMMAPSIKSSLVSGFNRHNTSKDDSISRRVTFADLSHLSPVEARDNSFKDFIAAKSLNRIGGMDSPNLRLFATSVLRLTASTKKKKSSAKSITIPNRMSANDGSVNGQDSMESNNPEQRKDHSQRAVNQSIYLQQAAERSHLTVLEKELSKRIYQVPPRKSLSAMCVILFVVAILPLVAQISLGLAKLDVKFEVYKEIRTKVVNIDRSSWVIWAIIMFMQSIDNARLAVEGNIPKDIYAMWGIPDLLENEQARLLLFPNQLITYQRLTDLAMLNTTFATNYQSVVTQSRIKTYFLDQESKWQSVLRKPSEAVAFMQSAVDNYCTNTNYTSESMVPVGEDRDLDPQAEFLRKNLQGDILSYGLKVCDVVKAYFLDITIMNYSYMVWSQYANWASISIIIMLLVSVLTVWGRITHQRLRTQLRVKPEALKESKSVTSRLAGKFSQMSLDTIEAYCHPIVFFGANATKSANRTSASEEGKTKILFHSKRPNAKRNKLLTGEGILFPGLSTRMIVLAAILSASALIELSTALSYIQEANKVKNLVFVYTAIIDFWNIAFVMQQATESAIIWGNSVNITEMPAFDAAKKYRHLYETIVLTDIMKTRSLDLGNLTADYVSMTFGNHSLCADLKETKGDVFANCGEGLSSFVDTNYYAIFRKTNSLFEQVHQGLDKTMDSKQARLQFLSEGVYGFYRGYTMRYDEMWTEIYYRVTLPLMKALELIINKDKSLVAEENPDKQFYFKMHGGVLIVCCFLAVGLFVLPVLRICAVAKTISMLLPLQLLLSNTVYVQQLKRRNFFG